MPYFSNKNRKMLCDGKFFLVSSFINDDPCPVNKLSQDGIFEFLVNDQINLSSEYLFQFLFQLKIRIKKIDIFIQIENHKNIDVTTLKETLTHSGPE